MDLESLNKIANEAKDLDRERNIIHSARSLVKSTGSNSKTLFEQIRTRDNDFNDYSRAIHGRHELVHKLVSEYIESIRADMLEAIEARLLSQEKQLLSRASMKRQLITASIVSKPADTDGGAS